VTLPNKNVMPLLRNNFVMAFKNIDGKTRYAGKSNKHMPTMAAQKIYNCTAAKNIQMFILTEDGKIVHCLPGFWDVKPFIAEVQFAMKLNKIYKSKMSIADRNEKFLDAHLTHALHHDAKTIGASKHQGFDKKYLERTGNKDFQRAKGFQSKGLKRSDQVMHERMAERPFLAFEKFNVAKFVEMGRRVYRYNYGTGNSRDRQVPGNMKSRRRGRKKEK